MLTFHPWWRTKWRVGLSQQYAISLSWNLSNQVSQFALNFWTSTKCPQSNVPKIMRRSSSRSSGQWKILAAASGWLKILLIRGPLLPLPSLETFSLMGSSANAAIISFSQRSYESYSSLDEREYFLYSREQQTFFSHLNEANFRWQFAKPRFFAISVRLSNLGRYLCPISVREA